MSQDDPPRDDPAAPRPPLIPGFGPDPTEPLPPAPAAPAQPWPGHIAAVEASDPEPGEGSSRPGGRPADIGARDPRVPEDQAQEAVPDDVRVSDGTLVDHPSSPLVASPGEGAGDGSGVADADRSSALAAASTAAGKAAPGAPGAPELP